MDDKPLPLPFVLLLCGGDSYAGNDIIFDDELCFDIVENPTFIAKSENLFCGVRLDMQKDVRSAFWQVVRSMEAQSWAKEIGLVVYGITDNLGKSFHISSNRKCRSHDGDLYYDGFISQSEAATPFEALQNLVTEIYKSGVCRG